jgi:hypothetical protein
MMLAYAFLLVAVAFRFLPHAFGFTPILAALLYFGARRPRKEVLCALPLLAAADLALNAFVYHYPFSVDLLITWAWYAAIMLGAGAVLRNGARPLRLAGASLTGSVSFFVISNFAVWLAWRMYPMTWQGLTACYAAAVPFFRYTPLGDLVFTAVFFGIGAMVESRHEARAHAIA